MKALFSPIKITTYSIITTIASQIFGFKYSTEKEDQDIPFTIKDIDIDLANLLFIAS